MATTVLLEHASYASHDQEMTDKEALAAWREGPGPEDVRKWHEDFTPELRETGARGR